MTPGSTTSELRRRFRSRGHGNTIGAGYLGGMVRSISYAPEVVDPVDGLPLGVVTTFPTRSGDGRERMIGVLRADGLRFRDGARWRSAL